jgi:MFS family permease
MPPVLVAISVDLDAPLASIVRAAGAYFLAYGLAQPVWGVLSDSLGRVRTMRLTFLVAGLAALAAALAWDPLSVGIARGIGGGFMGAVYPAGLIYVGDTVPPQRRQHDVTRLMVGVAGLALAWALRALPEPPRSRVHATPYAPLVQALRSRTVLFVLLMAFLEGAVLLGVLTLLPAAVEAAGASAGLAGAVTAIYGVAVFAAAPLVGRLSRSLHPARLIGLGGGSALCACVVLAVSRAPAAAVVVTLLLGLAWPAMHSSLQTWATEVLPAARAAVVSLFAGALFCGSALAAVLVSELADAGRYRTIFTAAAVATVPLAALATWGRARWRRPT